MESSQRTFCSVASAAVAAVSGVAHCCRTSAHERRVAAFGFFGGATFGRIDAAPLSPNSAAGSQSDSRKSRSSALLGLQLVAHGTRVKDAHELANRHCRLCDGTPHFNLVALTAAAAAAVATVPAATGRTALDAAAQSAIAPMWRATPTRARPLLRSVRSGQGRSQTRKG